MIFLSIFRKDLFIQFIEWVWVIISGLWSWNYLLVFFSGLAESLPIIWIVVPWQNVLLLVGWFFAQKWIDEMFLVILCASIWGIIWNYFAYFLWKKYWKTFFKKYGLWLWIWETEVSYLEKWVEKWGPIWIIVWKFQPTTRAFLPFIAWSMWMKSRKFMLYNIIWSVVYSAVIVWIGLIFVNHFKTIIKYMELIFLGIFIIAAIYIYNFKREEFKKYWEMKNREIDAKVEEKMKAKK